jgi:hypothetical protein
LATLVFPKLPFLGFPLLLPSLEFKLRVLALCGVLATAVAVVGETEEGLSLDLVEDQSIRVKGDEAEAEEDLSSIGGVCCCCVWEY